MTQFYSRNDVNYSGDVYSIPFKYIHKKEVKVYIDDELWTKWHFLNTNQLTLDEVPEGIGYNNIVSVRRETDIEDKVVTYDNNSLLNKENLNKSQDQLLYAVQELYDNNTQFAIDVNEYNEQFAADITNYNEQFARDIRAEVDAKVEAVSDAVEKLEFLEDSVEIANEAALEAAEQAEAAKAQMELAKDQVEQAEEVKQQVEEMHDYLDANAKALPMFTPIWTDHILNDVSYLRADTFSWHNAKIYKTGYSILEEEYNNDNCIIKTEDGVEYKLSPRGFKIAHASQHDTIINLYENNKNAWFYIIDIENRRFKLPREKNNEKKYLYFFVGNYVRPDTEVNIGELVEIVNNRDFEGQVSDGKAELNATKNNCIKEINSTSVAGRVLKTGDIMTGALYIQTTQNTPFALRSTRVDAEAYNEIQFQDHTGTRRNSIRSFYTYDESGAIQKSTFTIGSNKLNGSAPSGLVLTCGADDTLYFDFPKCTTRATTTSTAANNKVAVIVENYLNGTSWYRVWSDGWCEQGGWIVLSGAISATNKRVTFLKPYKTTPSVYCSQNANAGVSNIVVGWEGNTEFSIGTVSGACTGGTNWYARGYIK